MTDQSAQESVSKQTGRTWIPLESNPEVFNKYAYQLGLLESAQFGDIFGLDPELLAMVPQPVKAVVLIFPYEDNIKKLRKEQDAELANKEQPHLDPSLIFIKQKISNACGTIGLLHSVMNAGVPLDPEGTLSTFLEQCMGKSPEERADLLASTPLFASAHQAAATSSESSSAVPTDLRTNLHFTAFVQAPSAENPGESRLVELDGTRPGPVDHGTSKDILKDVAEIAKKNYISVLSDNVQFGMVALSEPEPE